MQRDNISQEFWAVRVVRIMDDLLDSIGVSPMLRLGVSSANLGKSAGRDEFG